MLQLRISLLEHPQTEAYTYATGGKNSIGGLFRLMAQITQPFYGAGFRRIPPLKTRFFQGATEQMNGMLQVELTSEEREIILRGLRYVRSAILLGMRDPSRDDKCRRAGHLDEIQNLCQRLESAEPPRVHA